MKRIFVDTNVILDLLAKREPFHLDSMQIFSLADLGNVELCISSLSLVNAHYILKEVMKLEDARSIIARFKVLVKTYELNDKIIELALNDKEFKDFEDGIQYYTALEAQCDLILTRNVKDFKNAKLPLMRPNEYLSKINFES